MTELEESSRNEGLYVKDDGSFGRIDELEREFIDQQKIDNTSVVSLFKAFLLREVVQFGNRKGRIFSVKDYKELLTECNSYFQIKNVKAERHGSFKLRFRHLQDLGLLKKLENVKVRWKPMVVTPKGFEFIRALEYLLPDPLPRAKKGYANEQRLEKVADPIDLNQGGMD